MACVMYMGTYLLRTLADDLNILMSVGLAVAVQAVALKLVPPW